jgi:hypothetical protein
MAQGATISERLKKANARTEELNRAAMAAGATVGPRSGYRMNDDEFQHHIVALTHERIIKEKLGMSDDEYKLYVVETWNDEWAKLIEVIKKGRSEAIRAELTRGVVIKPNIDI